MSYAKRSVLVTLLLVGAGAMAQPTPATETSITSLSWLGGCWNSENAEPGSGEQWMPLAGNTLMGLSRTIRGGKTTAFEFMRIAPAPDGKLTYFVQPSGQPAASFAVLLLKPHEVVFENLEHPFPQRINYRFEPPSKLHASIEGTRNGAKRSIAFPMVRVSCDSLLPTATPRP